MAQAERAARPEEEGLLAGRCANAKTHPPRRRGSMRGNAHQQQPSATVTTITTTSTSMATGSGHPRKRKTFLDTLGDIFD